MRTFNVSEGRKPKKDATAGAVLTFLVVLAVVLAIGGWALMLTVSLLGGSVSYGHAVSAYALLRLVILPTPSPSRSTS